MRVLRLIIIKKVLIEEVINEISYERLQAFQSILENEHAFPLSLLSEQFSCHGVENRFFK